MSDEKYFVDDLPLLTADDIEMLDNEELLLEEEEAEEVEEVEEMKMVEASVEEDVQMVAKPTVGNRMVGQTHHKFRMIRDEKPTLKKKYLGKAKSW